MAAATALMSASSALASAPLLRRSPAAGSPASQHTSSLSPALQPRKSGFLGTRLDGHAAPAATSSKECMLVARAGCGESDSRGGRTTGGARWQRRQDGGPTNAAGQPQSARRGMPSRSTFMTPFGPLNVMAGTCNQPVGFRGWGMQPLGLNQLFNELFNDFSTVAPLRRPVWNVQETSNAYQVRMELPGFSKEEVKVQLEEGNILVIRAQRLDGDKDSKAGPQGMRRREGFQARFRLADNVTAEKIGAEMKNGVLNLTFPKVVQEKASAVDIQVTEPDLEAQAIDLPSERVEEANQSEQNKTDHDKSQDSGEGIPL